MISDIIAGIDHVTAHSNEIVIVSLSFGCECSSPAHDAAINNGVRKGVVFAETSGNDEKDASSLSSAQNPNVMPWPPWPMATENVEDEDLLQIMETMTLLHNRVIIECS